MKDPRGAAMKAEDYDQAKDVHGRVHHDLTNSYHEMTPAELTEHEAAMRLLEADHPRLKSSRRRLERKAQTEHERDERTSKKRRPSSGRATTGSRSGPRGSAARRPARSRTRRAVEQTGIPGAARSVSSSLLQGLGIVVGLSMAYLFLRNAETAGRGQAAIEQISKGVARGVQLLIRPVDPLVATSSTSKSAPLPNPSVNPLVNPLAKGPVDPRKAPTRAGQPQRTLPNYKDLLGATTP